MSDLENHEAGSHAGTAPPRTALTVRDVLVAARALIENPEDWRKGAYRTRDADGHVLARCACGALQDASRPKRAGQSSAAYQALKAAMGGDVCEWNDDHTHAEVLAAFDKAIAECAP
jgi:hypothetical protein